MAEKNNKKKKVMILVLVLGLVLLTVGTTYAFFTYSRQGVEEHVLTTGSLYFVYDELQDQEENQISIGNAFPVSDEKGIEQEKPGMFEFEVRAKNQGADINYEIYLTKDESSTLPEKVVDTYLTTTGKKGENAEESLVTPSWDNKWTKENGVTQYQFIWNSHVPVLEEGQQGKSLYQETIPSTNNEEYSKVFRYRMWLDESADDVNAKGEWIYGGKSFTVRVNVYASNEELPSPTPVGVMQKWNFDIQSEDVVESDFHTLDKFSSISKISFANKIEIPESVSQDNQWDISEKKDKSVMAYMTPNGETCEDMFGDEETIQCNDIVIASNGETYGNPDSSFAFSWFMNLKTVDFTNFNTSLVENIAGMFFYCMNLTSLDLSNWDLFSLKIVGDLTFFEADEVDSPVGPFTYCGYNSELNITGLDKLNMTNIDNLFAMFSGTNLSSNSYDSIKNWDTSNVTDMSWMFADCGGLIELDLSELDISNVTDMHNMFTGCDKLTSLDLSDWTTSNVADMSYMFFGCKQLTDLSSISNWDTTSVTNMSGMFYYCSQLTGLDLSKWDTANVTDMTSMFAYCSQLTGLDLSSWNTSSLTSVSYFEGDWYLGMFRDCESLKTINLSGWDMSKVTSLAGMFKNCSQLSEIIGIEDWDTSNVFTTGSYEGYGGEDGMFYNCSNLTNLDLSKWDTSKMTDMLNMFGNCSQVSTTITIRGNVAKYNTMFYNAATAEGASITVNYVDDATMAIAQAMIETANGNENVKLGTKVA